MKNGIFIIQEKLSASKEWLENCDHNCEKDQKHLDSNSSEQAYWCHGYAMALKDVLNFLGENKTIN